MLFNSLDFAVFLPLVFAIYWLIGSGQRKLQNSFLLFSSYLFYGWWDWRFLTLILASSVLDYVIGLRLVQTEKSSAKKRWLAISLVFNLGLLGFFKYYNFFIDNFVEAFSILGSSFSANRLNIVLPVGISFYTFQTLSYSIDVYRGKLKPSKDFIAFSAFVSFFPQLVAGPIERASNLLPQFQRKRSFDYAKSVDGCRQILWGLFKKVVIADNCAIYVNDIYANGLDQSGSTLLLATVLFAFQIYGDFSGYSDIAIGTARLFGFNLMQNFAFPYFSRDIAEFWRRWHISLSTWFRDYLYIPLGGSRGTIKIQIRNVVIIFLVSGFWHGANWTFIIWGALHALYFIPLLLLNRNRKNVDHIAEGRFLPGLKVILSIVGTFLIVTLAWVFFRAPSVEVALGIIQRIVGPSLLSIPEVSGLWLLLLLIPFFLTIEWIGRHHQYALEKVFFKSTFMRRSFYVVLVGMIGLFMQTTETPFIYFQF